ALFRSGRRSPPAPRSATWAPPAPRPAAISTSRCMRTATPSTPASTSERHAGAAPVTAGRYSLARRGGCGVGWDVGSQGRPGHGWSGDERQEGPDGGEEGCDEEGRRARRSPQDADRLEQARPARLLHRPHLGGGHRPVRHRGEVAAGPRASLIDGYCYVDAGEVWMDNAHIAPYVKGTWTNHAARRKRKLLLHKQEIEKLASKSREKGFTIVPLEIYFLGSHAKVLIGLARGKKEWDKR